MTFDDLLVCENNTPVRCVDGKLGLLIRWWKPASAGVQVPGEEQIREIPCVRLVDRGGVLVELPEVCNA